MLHLGHCAALLMVVSTLSRLTSGQATVDTALLMNANEACDSGDYTLLLRAILAGQTRLESRLQQQGGSSGSCKPQQNAPVVNGILIQQHVGGTAFFNRSWDEFKVGFGNASDNYWIGNERLHQLTKDGRYKLRVDLLSKFNGLWYWAEYDRFSVGSEYTRYTLLVSHYSGNAGDGMNVDGLNDYNLNGARFNTYDRYSVDSRCIGTSVVVGGFWYVYGGYGQCGFATVNRQSPYFAWKGLPIGTRRREHVALVRSRMTLIPK